MRDCLVNLRREYDKLLNERTEYQVISTKCHRPINRSVQNAVTKSVDIPSWVGRMTTSVLTIHSTRLIDWPCIDDVADV